MNIHEILSSVVSNLCSLNINWDTANNPEKDDYDMYNMVAAALIEPECINNDTDSAVWEDFVQSDNFVSELKNTGIFSYWSECNEFYHWLENAFTENGY